jgi:hypothetical protein
MALRPCSMGRREFRRLSRAGAVELADGLTGDGGACARELVRYLFAAMVLSPPAGSHDTRNGRPDIRVLVEHGRAGFAPKVSVPTLAVHYRNDRSIPFEAGRELAAGITGARFVPLERDAHLFFFNDTRPLLRAIAEFLGDPVEEVGRPPSESSKSPSAPEAERAAFCREGGFWTIACRGEVFRLRDVRGLAYIAYLLGHPGEEFHVLSVASRNGSKQGEADELAEPVTKEQATQSDLTVGRMGDAGEMLDAQAKAAYKRRTAELREQLDEARERNQLELVDRLEDEIESAGRELSRAVGLGGRDRRAASAAERARINVTRAIKIALERIAEHNPALATLLTSSIRTGTFCSSTPDSRLPASWQLYPPPYFKAGSVCPGLIILRLGQSSPIQAH